jgi:hypothetical protein
VSRIYFTKIGELEELFMQAMVQARGEFLSFAREKIWTPYIAYEKGIAAENSYRIGASRLIRHHVGDVLGGMPRCLQHTHYHILYGNRIALG